MLKNVPWALDISIQNKQVLVKKWYTSRCYLIKSKILYFQDKNFIYKFLESTLQGHWLTDPNLFDPKQCILL